MKLLTNEFYEILHILEKRYGSINNRKITKDELRRLRMEINPRINLSDKNRKYINTDLKRLGKINRKKVLSKRMASENIMKKINRIKNRKIKFIERKEMLKRKMIDDKQKSIEQIQDRQIIDNFKNSAVEEITDLANRYNLLQESVDHDEWVEFKRNILKTLDYELSGNQIIGEFKIKRVDSLSEIIEQAKINRKINECEE
ncbi:hypothetical protein LABALGNA3A7_09610 [Dellaglioa algida]|nr:hypothetical protein LABALGNA3A7_09610 [Dellaglioa algida]